MRNLFNVVFRGYKKVFIAFEHNGDYYRLDMFDPTTLKMAIRFSNWPLSGKMRGTVHTVLPSELTYYVTKHDAMTLLLSGEIVRTSNGHLVKVLPFDDKFALKNLVRHYCGLI